MFGSTKFRMFRDEFTILLYATRGCCKIIMEYVIRSGTTSVTLRIESPTHYANRNDVLISIHRENTKVYIMLRSTFTETLG